MNKNYKDSRLKFLDHEWELGRWRRCKLSVCEYFSTTKL